MYVDDLLTSVDTEEEAKYVCTTSLLIKRGFELRKWKSNEENLIRGLNFEQTDKTVDFCGSKEHES